MARLGSWAPRMAARPPASIAAAALVERRRSLHCVLRFTGYSIDDVVNDPVARNAVFGYFKLQKYVQRGCEAVDMDRWWNGQGMWVSG